MKLLPQPAQARLETGVASERQQPRRKQRCSHSGQGILVGGCGVHHFSPAARAEGHQGGTAGRHVSICCGRAWSLQPVHEPREACLAAGILQGTALGAGKDRQAGAGCQEQPSGGGAHEGASEEGQPDGKGAGPNGGAGWTSTGQQLLK